jgi:hypothetical protein
MSGVADPGGADVLEAAGEVGEVDAAQHAGEGALGAAAGGHRLDGASLLDVAA